MIWSPRQKPGTGLNDDDDDNDDALIELYHDLFGQSISKGEIWRVFQSRKNASCRYVYSPPLSRRSL